MKQIKEVKYLEHRHCVAEQILVPDEVYKSLKEKQKRGQTTEAEDQLLEKNELFRLYETPDVTPDLIEKHDHGWHPQLQLHYYLTVGNCYLPEKEKKALEGLSSQGDGVFKIDANKRLLACKIHALQKLGVEQFLDPEKEFSSESLWEWYEQLTHPFLKSQIKTILGFSIGVKDSAIGVAQRFLEKLGLKLRYDRRQRNLAGKSLRIYRGCDLAPDERAQIFARWLERDKLGAFSSAVA